MVPVSDRASFVALPRFTDILEISQVAAATGIETLVVCRSLQFPGR